MRRVLLFLAGSALLAAAPCGAAAEKKYGKALVAEYRVPIETIEKYATFKPSTPGKHENKLEAVLLAKTEDWSGPFFDAKYASNPYTIVVTLTGTAKADGDALTMWQAGWRLGGNESVANALSGLSKLGARAGERFSVTAASIPTRFKDDRNVAVLLGLVRANNVDISSVDVAVWSGIPKSSWIETLGAFSYLLIGIVFLALVWWWRRRQG